MKPLQLPLLTAALSLLSQTQAIPSPNNPPLASPETSSDSPEFVWRGEQEKRSPEDVKRAGGFRAIGLNSMLKGGVPTEVERDMGSGLYAHTAGFDLGTTLYVSTSTDPLVAASFAHIRSDTPGYVYLIHTDSKFIDVEASLKEAAIFPFDKEHVAVGLIPWDQIVGWFDLKDADFLNFLLGLRKPRDHLKAPDMEGFHRNSDFNAKYLSEMGTGGQPQLAGFSKSAVYWEREPWLSFRGQSAADNLEAYVRKHVHVPMGDEGVWKWALKTADDDYIPFIDEGEAGLSTAVENRAMACCEIAKRSLVDKRDCVPCRSNHDASHMDDSEILALASENSKDKFDSLLHEFGYEAVATHQPQLHDQLATRLEQVGQSSRLERIQYFSAKYGGQVVKAGGLLVYGTAVADSFTHEASVLDRAAVMASILPVIGCAIRVADDASKGEVDAARASFCFIEDVLVLAGLWEFGLAWQALLGVAETLQGIEEQDKLYDPDVFRAKRLQGWESKIREMEAFIESDEFMSNVTSRYDAHQIGLLFQASQMVGDLHAVHHVIQTPHSYPSEKQAVQAHHMVRVAMDHEMEKQICIETARNKMRVREALHTSMLNATRKLALDYDQDFFRRYWLEATRAVPFIGFISISPPATNVEELRSELEFQRRNVPLPSFQDRILAAVDRVIERLDTPATCLCRQGNSSCEFADCASPAAAQTASSSKPQAAVNPLHLASSHLPAVAKTSAKPITA
ncbi:putative enterotoxin [Ophiocordyceps camponoti-rufipedis]|uniref:Putative enterotoxin n=1 Tax=Ophiocordyceps camponoti-rufipedis TaxID=2004952 RepID=A0A2C5YJA1_9HYPO|nr:putative enterotoxin [Ophiocordyceps camponoti-rufipedis]